MREIADNVYLLEGMRVSNVYVLASGASLTLVDSGLKGEGDKIADQIKQAGFRLDMVHNIILTHAHGDHLGNAQSLIQLTGAQIIAHRDEVSYIEKTDVLPASSTFFRWLNWLSDHIVFRLPHCKVNQPVTDGDILDILGGLRIIHTPGHTPGSLSLYQPDREILFCGDTLFNIHPVTRQVGLQLPTKQICVDYAEALNSIRRLAQLKIKILCCGHGQPLFEDPVPKMTALLI